MVICSFYKAFTTDAIYTVETARHFIGVIVELTAGMQYRHDNFCCRYAFFLMDRDRNTTAVIAYRNRTIDMDSNGNIAAVAG